MQYLHILKRRSAITNDFFSGNTHCCEHLTSTSFASGVTELQGAVTAGTGGRIRINRSYSEKNT